MQLLVLIHARRTQSALNKQNWYLLRFKTQKLQNINKYQGAKLE